MKKIKMLIFIIIFNVIGFEAKCLEVSLDEKYLFIGGIQNSNSNYGEIICLKFCPDTEYVTRLKVGTEETSMVTSLRRHPRSDVIFAGGFRSISILYFESKIKG